MADLGIMIEGQEGLTWARFSRLTEAVEDLGFESLFRSDHLTALEGHPRRATLALWPSLTYLAIQTRSLRFGPLVSPMTFRHPAIVARAAAAVSELSGGRLDMGIGAGWFAGEHRMFGIPYPPYAERLEMLEEGARVLQALWSGRPATFQGRYYSLDEAQADPAPPGRIPLILGGKGERTLQLVARYADEWNFSYQGPDAFAEKSARLDKHLRAEGRPPADVRRSLMVPFVIGTDERAIQARIDAHRATFTELPATLAGWHEAGFPGGTPDQLLEQLGAFIEAGVTRFMLQHNDLDDLDSLEMLARRVLPHL
jgi:F420-dependent oxidoreductase-like protein